MNQTPSSPKPPRPVPGALIGDRASAVAIVATAVYAGDAAVIVIVIVTATEEATAVVIVIVVGGRAQLIPRQLAITISVKAQEVRRPERSKHLGLVQKSVTVGVDLAEGHRLSEGGRCGKEQTGRHRGEVKGLDNGSGHIAADTKALAREIGLEPRTTPVRSPQSNGMAEAFVRTMKRDYVRVSPRPDARAVIAQIPGWFEHRNAVHPHRAPGHRSPREFIAHQTTT